MIYADDVRGHMESIGRRHDDWEDFDFIADKIHHLSYLKSQIKLKITTVKWGLENFTKFKNSYDYLQSKPDLDKSLYELIYRERLHANHQPANHINIAEYDPSEALNTYHEIIKELQTLLDKYEQNNDYDADTIGEWLMFIEEDDDLNKLMKLQEEYHFYSWILDNFPVVEENHNYCNDPTIDMETIEKTYKEANECQATS